MSRLIDDLRSATYRGRITPQTYFYNFTRKPEQSVVHRHDDDTDREYRNYVLRLNKSPVLVIDRVTDYVFGSPKENWELNTDLPCLIPKLKSCFFETKAPKATRYFTEHSPLPDAWGWLVHHIGGDVLRAHAAKLEVPVDSGATQAIHCTLSIKMQGVDLVSAPVYTYIWPLDPQGAMIGTPMRGYGVETELEMLPPSDVADHYFAVLALPMLMAIAFLNSDLTSYDLVKHSDKLQQARKKKAKPPLANYNILLIDKLVDVLRFEGQSGLLGLRHAIQTCRREFLHGTPKVIRIHA